jgi:hypothetical protein
MILNLKFNFFWKFLFCTDLGAEFDSRLFERHFGSTPHITLRPFFFATGFRGILQVLDHEFLIT